MDILVGWHIDTQQDESLINFIAGKYFRLVLTLQNSLSLSLPHSFSLSFSPSLESLVSLQQFWIEDISFSVDLLKQFLEDMDAYTNVCINSRQHNIHLCLFVSQELAGGSGNAPVSPDDQSTPEQCLSKLTALIRYTIQ